jgi:NitT/TauT family transport system substrate-binding protein
MDPAHNKGVTIVQEPFTMDFFLKRQADAASAMTYNELAQVLEAKNPKTGKLYTMKDLNVIKMQTVGTSMLEDNIFTTTDYLKSSTNRDTAKKFIAASHQGWIYCRSHFKECVNIVLANGPALPRGHQTWQMNEINALVWPAPDGIGVMNKAAFDRTANIAQQFKVITKAPSADAYRTDIAQNAVDELDSEGVDVHGNDWKKATIKVTPGGS